jgi:hypothetical protein
MLCLFLLTSVVYLPIKLISAKAAAAKAAASVAHTAAETAASKASSTETAAVMVIVPVVKATAGMRPRTIAPIWSAGAEKQKQRKPAACTGIIASPDRLDYCGYENVYEEQPYQKAYQVSGAEHALGCAAV